MSANVRRNRENARVQPIAQGDPLEKGLPTNVDAERMVLGSILLDDSNYPAVTEALDAADFSLEKHRRIYAAMAQLHRQSEHIDRITVANELMKSDQLEACDGLGYLVSLDDGLPQIPHLDSYLRIVRETSLLRSVIFATQNAREKCLLQTGTAPQILAALQVKIQALSALAGIGRSEIRFVEDLQSVFTNCPPLEYIREPELPAKSVVTLIGNSESGKTTLACAFARDAMKNGHSALLLDRDKNPRERIKDRLTRLGISPECNQLWVWDNEQPTPPPQPDSPIVLDWVSRRFAETRKSPIVIVDSLISFLLPAENENDAKDMRAFYDRCRGVTAVGGTVVVIAHTNRQGEARGSSDLKPAGDQSFLVSNRDGSGGRLLDLITLKYEKSRYGLSGKIVYRYANGVMIRAANEPPGKRPRQPSAERLKALLVDNPGVLSDQFVKQAQEASITREVARDFLREGESSGTIRVEVQGRGRLHFWNTEQSEGGAPRRD